MAPRETENNAYGKFWGDKQRASWYVMAFSGMANMDVQYQVNAGFASTTRPNTQINAWRSAGPSRNPPFSHIDHTAPF